MAGAGPVLLVACALVGCGGSLAPPHAEFETPIAWSSVPRETDASPTAEQISLRLESDGTAHVINFPQGTAGRVTINDKTYVCFDRMDAPLYSGPATWETKQSNEIIVNFAESSVPLFSDKAGYFLPDADWEYVSTGECGAGATGAHWKVDVGI